MNVTSTAPHAGRSTASTTAFAALVGLASLAVLLQALWAGLFIRESEHYNHSWVEVHSRGAEVAIVLAAAATVVGFWRLRPRRELWLGAAALTVLLVVEAYLGGLIGEHSGWTAIHIPLAMALVGLAVWLPLRARHLTTDLLGLPSRRMTRRSSMAPPYPEGR